PTAQNAFFNLLPGAYTIVVEDAEGCSATLSAIIEEPEELVITLTPEAIIEIGDSYQIIAQVNVPVSELQSVLWTPSTGLSCDTCLTLIATPQISTQYKVEVKTEVGCRDDATLRLLVDRSVDVYIPNVFSPDGDGNNDFFTVFAEQKKVTKIHSLQVYSRWGELLWERFDFDPNIPNIGWDGKHRGQDMNPGVYVYQAEIEFIDGRKEIFKGDITIVR
ncbi:MAG: gliding motility-associated C-terminal domain-containing protein, partial [Bacteroidota bacterium]